jgi:hypothetical protein
MQHLVGAERKNYDREKPQEYRGRASQQAAGRRTGCRYLSCHLIPLVNVDAASAASLFKPW